MCHCFKANYQDLRIKVSIMKNLSKAYYKNYFEGIAVSFKDNGDIETDIGDISNSDKKNNKKGKGGQQNSSSATSKKEEDKNRNTALLNLANKDYCEKANDVFQFFSEKNETESYAHDAFVLTVLYPGVITGVGINHEAKVKGEFKLGIHLDYTTGLPVIYGSSVKGVLRDAFKSDVAISVLKDLVPGKLHKKLDDIETKLSKREKSLKDLMTEIFGEDKDKDERSVYKRDIFLDAIVCGMQDGQKSMLAADAITPHTAGPLKEPTPIGFVRIASGTSIRFRFRLVDSTLTIKEKLTLFKAILIAFGIGAKTNVGYGQLEEPQEPKKDK